MFNQDLFYSLCEKYEVELRNDFIAPMIEDNEKIIKINSNKIEEIFAYLKN